MGQIQSSVGLISGMNITQTVNNLMAVASGPVNALTTQNTQLQNQDTAYTQLSAQLLALQSDALALQQSSLYTACSATSSDSSALTATVTGTPALGTYQFTPIQPVQTQQLLSSGLASETSALGGGQITFRFGADVDQSTELSSLNGGQGYGTLGTIDLTDRSGATATVNLASAQTLGDVIDDINKAGIGIEAEINNAGNGITLLDTTGATKSNLIVANDSGDQTDTATKLGIAANGAVTSVNSGDMHLQVVSLTTQLSSLNGGAGVAIGTVQFTNAAGKTATLSVTSSMQTVGDVVTAINKLGLGITASVNATGDGILLTDTSQGTGTTTVAEGTSTTAADLHLLQTASSATQSGKPVQLINGSMTQTLTLTATDTLSSLVTKINNLDAGVTASIINDGSNTPYRLSLTSNQPGTAGATIVDTSGLKTSMPLTETVPPENAELTLGDSSSSSSVLISSSNNNFTDVLPGATLQVGQPTGEPVSITIGSSNSGLVAAVQSLVNDYNSFQSTLTQDTTYDTSTNTGAVLSDDPTATQVGTSLSNLLNQQIFGTGSIQSLAQLGITFNSDGSLALDTSTLQSEFTSNPDDVKEFFTQTTNGFAVQLDNLVNEAAGSNNSMLSSRMSALSDMMQDNSAKITSMNQMLSDQRQNLYNQFYQMEVVMSQLQNSMSIVNTLSTLNSDGSSDNIFTGITSSNSFSNLASMVNADAASQASAASTANSSSSSSTSSSSSS
jgi:flagellar hook-associated protein 2